MFWAIWVLANLVIKYTLYSPKKFPPNDWNWNPFAWKQWPAPACIRSYGIPEPFLRISELFPSSRISPLFASVPKTWPTQNFLGLQSPLVPREDISKLSWFLLLPARSGYRKTQGGSLDLNRGLFPFLRMFTVISVSISKAGNLSSM